MKLWHLLALVALWYWWTHRDQKVKPTPAQAAVKPTPDGLYYRVDQNPLGISTAGMDAEQKAAVAAGDRDYMLSGLSDGDQ